MLVHFTLAHAFLFQFAHFQLLPHIDRSKNKFLNI